MKKYLLLLLLVFNVFVGFSQKYSYERLWDKVEKYQDEELPKSALKVLDKIVQKAEKRKDAGGLFEANLEKIEILAEISENGDMDVVAFLKKEIAKNSGVVKLAYQLELARIYIDNYPENFYRETRTLMEENESEDIDTWDKNTFDKEIGKLCEELYSNKEMLAASSVEKYEYLGYFADWDDEVDFTLYEVFLFEYIYALEEIYSLKYLSKIHEQEAFLKTKQRNKVLELYQEGLKFSQENKMKNFYWNLERLAFTGEEIESEELLDVLLVFFEENKELKEAGLIMEEAIHQIRMISFHDDLEKELKYMKRIEFLMEGFKKNFPDAEVVKAYDKFYNSFRTPFLDISTNKNILEDSASKILVKYKNVDSLYLKIYRSNLGELDLKKATLIHEKKYDLKQKSQIQKSFIELPIPALEKGDYFIEYSVNDKFSNSKTVELDVSNYSLIFNNQIINAKTGKVLNDISVRVYNNQKIRDSFSKNFEIKSRIAKIDTKINLDEKGFIDIGKIDSEYYSGVPVIIEFTKDDKVYQLHSILGGEYPVYHETEYKKKEKGVVFEIFADRKIYRPNQEVHFKALAFFVNRNKGKITKKPISNKHFTVFLKDANGEEVDKKHLKTNDFGSLNGTFKIPKDVLLGEYTIYLDTDGNYDDRYIDKYYEDDFGFEEELQIQVEEYKRPKFKIELLPITELFSYKDSVKVKGYLDNFSGDKLQNIDVQYKIDYKDGVDNGIVQTDQDGNFEFWFVPDDLDRSFEIEITATDEKGETHSIEERLYVDDDLTIYMYYPKKMKRENLDNSIVLNITNSNRKHSPVKGKVKIYKDISSGLGKLDIQWGKRFNRDEKKYYEEVFYLSKEEHDTLFPNFAYSKKQKKGALVLDLDFDTEKSRELKLGDLSNLELGKYIIELETDSIKNRVFTVTREFALLSDTSKEPVKDFFGLVWTTKKEYQKGEDIVLKLNSNQPDLQVHVFVKSQWKELSYNVIPINKEIKEFRIPTNDYHVNEEVWIEYYWVYSGEIKSGNFFIKIAEEKEDVLEIKTKTFRDKLKPGAKEKWTFEVLNQNNKPVKSEVLASMYDLSLDVLGEHRWKELTNHWYLGSSYRLYNSNYYLSFQDFELKELQRDKFFTIIESNQIPKEQQGKKFILKGLMHDKDMNMEPLAYADVIISGTKRGTTTNIDGEFEIEVEAGDTVVFSFMGYETMEYRVSGFYSNISVTMEGNIENALEEISIGYSKSSASDTLKVEKLPVQIRKNLQETAFFYPNLKTDKNGKVSFEFESPEALTRWKLQLLAHTKDLNYAIKQLEVVTQKNLMVFPNAPRFVREQDTIQFQAKISSLVDEKLEGNVRLELFDGITGKPIDGTLGNYDFEKSFVLSEKGSVSKSWKFYIPDGLQKIRYRIIAETPKYSDGEQNEIPVLTNRKLMTETLPIWVNSKEKKSFTFEKLKNAESSSMKNHQLILELNSNSIWEAIQSLPYLMEYPYDCSEQTFSKLYSNILARTLLDQNPEIQKVLKDWINSGGLTSELEKNQELKSILIEETPWLQAAKSEEEQRKRIAQLFELTELKNQEQKFTDKLKQMQFAEGGFPWFSGGTYVNDRITLHIVTGFKHLQKLGVKLSDEQLEIVEKGSLYLDKIIEKKYYKILKVDNDFNEGLNHLSDFIISYLYLKSFDVERGLKTSEAIAYFESQAKEYWKNRSYASMVKIALYFHRNNEKKIASAIKKSLKEKSFSDEELGIYWKSDRINYYSFWYDNPVENQALMIEAFAEMDSDKKFLEGLKQWLLKNKQTNRWGTTKETTSAIYALVSSGTKWQENGKNLKVKIGKKQLDFNQKENQDLMDPVGTLKMVWKKEEINSELGTITVKKNGRGIAWGAMYWQYFEDLDKIENAKTGLSIEKKLYIKKTTNRGDVLQEITKENPVKVGDLVTVRIILKADRDMDFIHMKDMRASGFEPVNTISQYKWQDGLGYFESTRDASTNFFFSRVEEGTYIFEYDLRANNAGNFSNGITTIQNMYAPEFSSHTKGTRVEIK
ncbi:alpha-2-macroglobulin family protein [Aureivirga sp. CE67]|uniref:alpha-2-macroglobulin family protein n=1 Tax=Aureivirga sp. CE67 TaxID=1788983 RepID=UPI0018C98B39|nr:alpha-2-macroglobulin family protein [Aureivirga sp. CE67]